MLMSAARSDLEETEREAVYDAISSTRRRRALQLLVATDHSLTLADLATEIARTEQEPGGPLTEAQVDQIRITLYHLHIPKLADTGIVTYDPDERRVAMHDSEPLQQVESL